MIREIIIPSPFFQPSEKFSPQQLLHYCRLWNPLQAEFTFGVVKLTGQLAKELLQCIRYGNTHGTALHRELLSLQAPASLDELGGGREKSVMHDQLFEQQIVNAGIELDSLKIKLPVSVLALREAIQEAFTFDQTDSRYAMCMQFVVETIAPELFATQRQIFLRAGIADDLLVHSNLHIRLEGLHADEAQKCYSLMCQLYGPAVVQGLIKQYARFWREFLDTIAAEVY